MGVTIYDVVENKYIAEGGIQQRFKEANLLANDFNKYASPETKIKVEEAIRKALSEAVEHLVPVTDEDQFSRTHAYRDRLHKSVKANVKWRVGYYKGKTRKRMVKAMNDSKLTKISIAKGGGITIKYDFDKDVRMKLIPSKRPSFRELGRGSSGIHMGISSLEKWFREKRIVFPDSRGRNKFRSQAFATMNAWILNGKPPIMNDRALRISLNKDARDEYNESLTNSLSVLKKDISKDLINKLFK